MKKRIMLILLQLAATAGLFAPAAVSAEVYQIGICLSGRQTLKESENAEKDTVTTEAADTADAENAEKDTAAAEAADTADTGGMDDYIRGFQDAVLLGFGEESVQFDIRNANEDEKACSEIMDAFVAEKKDLIMADSLLPLLAAKEKTADIPILATAVEEYGSALGIEEYDGIIGGNISGTSSLAPLMKQAAMVNEIFPSIKTVGILYCSEDKSASYQAEMVKVLLEKLDYVCAMYPCKDEKALERSCKYASADCEVLYVPKDPLIAENASRIHEICMKDKTPVLVGDDSLLPVCGAASLHVEPYDIGVVTGEMAVRILAGGENISEMPVEYARKYQRLYNEKICEELKLTLPGNYSSMEKESDSLS
ncbi:MAG: ABC transporter substrate-binding protein [Blautia sp.]|nr:ABC transporter substrate-binding protein [Blautia sp.]